MNALRAAAVPLILISVALAGCSSQRSSWPGCAAVGGAGGALIGSAESAGAAAAGGAAGAVALGSYCWYNADSDEDGALDEVDLCPDTPKDMKVDGTGCPILPPLKPPPLKSAPVPVLEAAPVEKLEIRNLHFALNSAKLTAEDRKILDEAVKRLKAGAVNIRLIVTGHTDSTGTQAYNQKLSEKRAQSVAQYLVAAGVTKESILRIGGAGEMKPIASNAKREGRQQNRRVEIDVQP